MSHSEEGQPQPNAPTGPGPPRGMGQGRQSRDRSLISGLRGTAGAFLSKLLVPSKAAAWLGGLLQGHPRDTGVVGLSPRPGHSHELSPAQGGQEPTHVPCALPLPISASMSITMTTSRYCPLRAVSHGTSFSIRIPAPFPAFLVTLWSPECRRCIPDIPPEAHSLSKEPSPGPGGGRSLPQAWGTPKDRSPALQCNTALQLPSGAS